VAKLSPKATASSGEKKKQGADGGVCVAVVVIVDARVRDTIT
jgi:hypothetical protein